MTEQKKERKHFEQFTDQIVRLYPELHTTDNPNVPDNEKILSRSITFQVTDDCNLNCFVAGTKILMGDFSYKNIEDVQIGDIVMSFPEHTEKNKQLSLLPTKVTHTFIRHGFTRTITTADGESVRCTDEHPFLNGRREWTRAEKINAGVHKLTKFIGIDGDNQANINHPEYMVGYLVATYLGDGSLGHYKHGKKREKVINHQCRLAVKDTEIIERVCQYLDYYNIDYSLKPFKISSKYNITTNAIYFSGKDNANWLDHLIEDNLNKNINRNYLCGYLAGIIDTEGSVDNKSNCIRISNSNIAILRQTETALSSLGYEYLYDKDRKSANCIIKILRVVNPRHTATSLQLLKTIRPAVLRKSPIHFYGASYFKREDVQTVECHQQHSTVYNLETETHTYIANNFAVHNCSYCYQINKGKRKMSLEVAKKFVDLLLDATPENNAYINPVVSPFLIIEFIGGEPLLEVGLMDQIMDYFLSQAVERMHPWVDKYMISISSNGTLYFEPEVQKFLLKHRGHLSLSITIDGNKELHDSCRVFHDGRPSYDLAVAAAQDWMKTHKGYMGSKITIAPENVIYLYDALVHMVELGYEEINANCVYEKGWEPEHATELYNQMKRFADYCLENDKTYIFCSLYEDIFFRPMGDEENENWCWGKGTPILTSDGYKPIEEIKIGDLVYTEDGTIHPVIHTTSHFADNCVKISASGIFPLICTDNHKIFIKPFDYLGWKGKKHYRPYDTHQIKDIKHKDLIHLFQIPDGTVDYDANIAYLVGRYIAGGWDYENGRGKSFCCAFDKKKELEEKLLKANIDFHNYKGKTVEQYTVARNVNNPNNTELLRILSDCGHLATGKHLPSECFNWTAKSLKALLLGYMDADGSLNKKGQYRFNTVSYQLAQELMVVLRTLGYTPTCYKNKRKGEGMILGRAVNIQDRYEVYFYEEPHRSKYVHKFKGNMWTYGLKISPAEPQTVYNLTIDTNHSYVAGGIVSSNCGGTGAMLSCDPDGYLYPCIRYMESSLGEDQLPIIIGHVDRGLVVTEEEKETVRCLDCITRRSQSTDECYFCPIARGCAWCSAYNYQEFGTVDKRATYICEMHKARSLANVYYWNKVYEQDGELDENDKPKKFKMHCPKEWAIPIIGEEEYSYLLELSGGNENED